MTTVGVGDASTAIEVKTPIEATKAAMDGLKEMADNDHIADALANLEGNNNGKGENGALDKLEGGQYNVALIQIQKALEDLTAAEESDPSLDLSYTRRLLTLIARATATELIELAKADDPSGNSDAKIAAAEALLADGVALQDSGSYPEAVAQYEEAIRSLTGNTPGLSGAAGGSFDVGVGLALGVGIMIVGGIMAWRAR